MKNSLEKVLFNKITQNSTIVLGVSGGADSIYLLHKCLEIQPVHPFKIIVVHIDHGLRGTESTKDAIFVKSLANRHGLIFEKTSIGLKKAKGNIEELGRTARYDFFEQLRQKHQAEWILTAHHLNDNIETALFNLIRGSSFNGIKGMTIESKNRHLLRPLLYISKQQILSFLKEHKIVFRTDKSNNDIKFSRNLLRKKMIPLLKKINPNFETTFSRNLENFTEIANFLEQASQEWLIKNTQQNTIPLTLFLHQSPVLQKNILVELYKETYGSSRKLTHIQLIQILKIFEAKKANTKKEFGEKFFLKIIRIDGKYFFQKVKNMK